MSYEHQIVTVDFGIEEANGQIVIDGTVVAKITVQQSNEALTALRYLVKYMTEEH